MAISEGGSGASAGAIRAGRAFVELFAKDDNVKKGLDASRKKLADYSNSIARGGDVVGSTLGKVADKIGSDGGLSRVFNSIQGAFSGLFDSIKTFGLIAVGGIFLNALNRIIEILSSSTGITGAIKKTRAEFAATGDAVMSAVRGFSVFGKTGNIVGRVLRGIQGALDATAMKFAGLGVAATAAGVGGYFISDSLESFAVERGTQFARLADRFNETAENLSNFAYAANVTGVDIKQLEGIFENWGERIGQASQNTGEAADKLRMLGINAQRLALMPRVEQMKQLADAMLKIKNNEQRLQFLSSFFSDQGQVINPLFKKGSTGISALMQDSKRVGAEVTSDEAESALKADMAYTRLEQAIKGVIYQLGRAVMAQDSFLDSFVGGATTAAVRVRRWVEANSNLISTIELSAYVAIGLGASLLGVALGFKLASIAMIPFISGFAILSGLVAFFTTWPGIILGVGLALAAGAAGFASMKLSAEGLQSVIASLSDFAKKLTQDLNTTFRGIKDALAIGDLELAAEIAFAGLEVAWARSIIGLKEAWRDFKNWLLISFVQIGVALVLEMKKAFDYIKNPLKLWNLKIGDLGKIGARPVAAPEMEGKPQADALEQRRKDLEEKRNRLQQLVDEAAMKRRQKAAEGRDASGLGGQAAIAVFNAQRGSFAGAIGQGAFGFGDQVGQKMLEEQKSTTKVLGEVLNVVSGFSFKWAT